MPIYEYEGKLLTGSKVKGKLDLESVDDVKKNLRDKGIFPISIREKQAVNSLSFDQMKEIPYKDLAIMCRQLHFTLGAGIPVLRSINIVKNQIENKKLRRILESTNEGIQKGVSLSELFYKNKDIPYMLSAMVQVGEATGNIDSIMGSLADYYDNQHRQKKKIQNALTYPKFLFAFAMIVVIGLVTFVVPTFVEGILSAGQELPIPTKIVVGISYFIKSNLLLLIGIVIILLILKKVVIDKNKSIQLAIDRFLIKNKRVAAISQQIYTARFARTFGILIQGGMNILESLIIAADAVDNSFVKKAMGECIDMVKKGSSIGEALEVQEIFPLLLTQMMRVGEETGSLEDILKRTSDFYDAEADFALQRLTALVEPIMIITLAIIVGFVVISIAIPMFQVMGAV